MAGTVRSHPRAGSNSDGALHYYVEDHEDGPLRANGTGGPPRTDKQPLLVANTLKASVGKDGGGYGHEMTLVADTLTSGSHPGSNAPGRRREDDANLVAGFNHTGGGSKDVALTQDATPPLDSSNPGIGLLELATSVARLNAGASVRRLTPVECERLQGFPDGWTDLGGTPDSRRYAALGDAVTVNVAEWIGRRLIARGAGC